MNILLIGSGGREHALAWKMKQSPLTQTLYCAPGNAGIAQVAELVSLAGQAEILAFCQEKAIGLVVIGPEQPLVEGLADHLRASGIPVFGPGAEGAQLEGSKAFTKALCKKYNIPTAAYEIFTDKAEAKRYATKQSLPLVIKADGLAAGKGVIIAEAREQVDLAIDEIMSGAFGDAGATVVIEEFLQGEELSFFALCDGKTALEFGSAQDHKRAFDGDQGPNTGGMGTYSPPAIATDALRAQVMREIIEPTVAALRAEGVSFSGMLFAGLMLTQKGPQLLEYNTRFGDPETQVLMARLESDVVALLLACAKGELASAPAIRFKQQAAVCVVMASQGYPGAYSKGSVIRGLDKAGALPDTVVFHAGTAKQGNDVIATGGRVLGVTALGDTIKQAQENAYNAIDIIDWPEGFCRRDIAWRAV